MKYRLIQYWQYTQHSFWLSAASTGLLLGIGFIVPFLWFLAVVGIALCIKKVQTNVTYRGLMSWMGVVFTIKILCSLSWCLAAYPIDWIPLSGSLVQMSLIFFYWLSGGIGIGLGGIVFALLARASFKTKIYPLWLWYVTLPFFWLLAELAGALFFSLLTFGPGSFLQTYFSFGFVGYLLGTTPFGLFLAPLYAVYGLTVTIVFLAIGLLATFSRWSNRPDKKAALVVVVFIVITIFPSNQIFPVEQKNNHTSVISINTKFDAAFLATEDGAKQKSELVGKAVSAAVLLKPDFIILPEDSRYVQSVNEENNPYQAMGYFQFSNQGTDSILIDSGRADLETGEQVLRATIFDGVSKSIYQFDKQYLVPQGEYMPVLYAGLLTLLGYGETVKRVGEDIVYQPGPLLPRGGIPEYLPGVLFCSESIQSNQVSALATEYQVPFVAHPISHSWFHSSTILWQQLDVMLQIQSRTSGIPIVSAGNMAPGKLYLPDGSIETGMKVGEGERFELVQFEF